MLGLRVQKHYKVTQTGLMLADVLGSFYRIDFCMIHSHNMGLSINSLKGSYIEGCIGTIRRVLKGKEY